GACFPCLPGEAKRALGADNGRGFGRALDRFGGSALRKSGSNLEGERIWPFWNWWGRWRGYYRQAETRVAEEGYMGRSRVEMLGLRYEAERLVRSGVSRAQVSQMLGVHTQTLAQWALAEKWRKKDIDLERSGWTTKRT